MYEKTLHVKELFSGRILSLELHDVRLDDGTESVREIVRHRGAIAVLVRHADGRILLVRQFRKPVEEEVLELVAGTLDPGEDPAVCARRELAEETGFSADRLESLGDLYLTPGYSTERIHLFYAEVSGEPGEKQEDHDENVELVPLAEADFLERIREGSLLDAKTLAAWLRWTLRQCEVAPSGDPS